MRGLGGISLSWREVRGLPFNSLGSSARENVLSNRLSSPVSTARSLGGKNLGGAMTISRELECWTSSIEFSVGCKTRALWKGLGFLSTAIGLGSGFLIRNCHEGGWGAEGNRPWNTDGDAEYRLRRLLALAFGSKGCWEGTQSISSTSLVVSSGGVGGA